MFRSAEYTRWLKECMSIAKEAGITPIKGKYKLMIRVARPDKRRRDIDNLTKAASDFLQHAGIIEDDCLCEAVYCKWVIDGPPVTINIYEVRGTDELRKATERALQGRKGAAEPENDAARRSPAAAYAEAIASGGKRAVKAARARSVPKLR